MISGATDGSIAFWDLTGVIEGFMQRLSTFHVENFIDCQKRPRTGRGSQGGRWWRSLTSSLSKRRPGSASVTTKAGDETNSCMLNHATIGTELVINNTESGAAACSTIHISSLESDVKADDFSSEICEIRPLHVLSNVHQSGVNCLHVSDIEDCRGYPIGFLFNLISGGDDQALYHLRFELSLTATVPNNEFTKPDIRNSLSGPESMKNFFTYRESHNGVYNIKFLHHDKVTSAHSSAIKGKVTIS